MGCTVSGTMGSRRPTRCWARRWWSGWARRREQPRRSPARAPKWPPPCYGRVPARPRVGKRLDEAVEPIFQRNAGLAGAPSAPHSCTCTRTSASENLRQPLHSVFRQGQAFEGLERQSGRNTAGSSSRTKGGSAALRKGAVLAPPPAYCCWLALSLLYLCWQMTATGKRY